MLTLSRTRAVLYAGVFLYLAAARAHDVPHSMHLLGDQVRDWRIVLGPFSSLPLTGTPSTAGGTTFGPIFYWVLWLIRVLAGPFTSNLPHAGPIGLAIVQSAADVVLLHAAIAAFGSVPLALAVTLLAATAPPDMALTATIWNPPLAVALAKLTIAAVLLGSVAGRGWSMGRLATVVICGWLSVQAHLGGVLVAAPAIGWMLAQPFLERRWRQGLNAVRTAAELIVILQLPYLFHHLTTPATESGGARAREALAHAAAEPGSLRLGESAGSFSKSVEYVLWTPLDLPAFGWLLLAVSVIASWTWRRRPAVLAVTVAPQVFAVLAFSIWRGPLNEFYWYMPVCPAVAVACAALALALPGRTPRALAAVAVLLLVLGLQPMRLRTAWATDRMPTYHVLVRASRQMARQAPELRAIEAPFLPPSSDPHLLYEILGGRISPDAPMVGIVDPQGRVSYRPAR